MSTTRRVVCIWFCYWTTFGVVVATTVKELDCDFEVDTCKWAISNFTRTEYASRLEPSGPRKAQHGKFYINFDPVDKPDGHEGDVVSSPLDATASRYCLRFWYHMRGTTMGELEVYHDQNELWHKAGNQGENWNCGMLKLPTLQENAIIYFRAVKGPDIYSFIAIDNIEIFPPDVLCEQKGCESLYRQETTQQTESTGATSTVSSTQENIVVSTAPPETTGFEEYLPYVAGIPGGILIIGIIILIICLRRNKKKTQDREKRMMGSQHPRPSIDGRYFKGSFRRSEEEVYNDIDESKMEEHYVYIEETARDNAGYDKSKDNDYITPSAEPIDISKSQYYLTPASNKTDYVQSNTSNVRSDYDHHDAHTAEEDDDYLRPQEPLTVSNSYVSRNRISSLQPTLDDYETPMSSDGSHPRGSAYDPR